MSTRCQFIWLRAFAWGAGSGPTGDLTRESQTAKLERLPRERGESPRPVRARTLRTQQRAKSQCQKPRQVLARRLTRVAWSTLIDIPLVHDRQPSSSDLFSIASYVCCALIVDGLARSSALLRVVSSSGPRGQGAALKTSTESLILAQDERWRRA